MNIVKRIKRKIDNFLEKKLRKYRANKLKNKDFTIISNNCWAGSVYRRFGMPYNTPTVGLYFFAEDYVKFCHNLKKYLSKPLTFIKVEDSKYKEIILERNQQNLPIGKLDDVEIVFMHYKSEQEAKEKWDRRVKRVNYDNLIFKFSKMNLCSIEDLINFDRLDVKKKFCFVPPQYASLINCSISCNSAKGQEEIKNDTDNYGKAINVKDLINAKRVCGKIFEF